MEEVGSNRDEGRGWPCLRHLTPTSPTTHTQPSLHLPTRCTRAALTPIEAHTSTTTTTLILTPTRSPPTWPRPHCPPTTSTMPTSMRMEEGLQLEGQLLPAARRRHGTSSTRR